MSDSSESPGEPTPRPLGFYIWLHYVVMLLPTAVLVGLAGAYGLWSIVWVAVMFCIAIALVKAKLMRDLQRDIGLLIAQTEAFLHGRPTKPLHTAFVEVNRISAAFVEAGRKRQLIVDELHHRGKNMLAKVQALVASAIRTADSTAAAAAKTMDVIETLKRLDDLLVRNDMRGASLREVLGQELGVYRGSHAVELIGPDVPLSRSTAEWLGIVIHELATNAAKHGAFAFDKGTLRVMWQCHDGFCVMSWDERGTPRTEAPFKTGFGTRLIDNTMRINRGSIERRFGRDGLKLAITFPHPDQT